MARQTLTIATKGRLKRGAKPTLTIGSFGMLYYTVMTTEVTGGGRIDYGISLDERVKDNKIDKTNRELLLLIKTFLECQI